MHLNEVFLYGIGILAPLITAIIGGLLSRSIKQLDSVIKEMGIKMDSFQNKMSDHFVEIDRLREKDIVQAAQITKNEGRILALEKSVQTIQIQIATSKITGE